MSTRKIVSVIAAALFIAGVAVGISGKTIKLKKADKEYTPTVSTVCITAVGDCTFATDANAPTAALFHTQRRRTAIIRIFSEMSRSFLRRTTLL